MRRAVPLGLALALGGCAVQLWAVPQPEFTTRDPHDAWARAVKAVETHCGGVKTVNEESAVIVGAWQAWSTVHGVVLTQCLVTLLRGDEHVREVRVSFASRECPLADLSDVEALVPQCQAAALVPELVSNSLRDLGAKLQADIAR